MHANLLFAVDSVATIEEKERFLSSVVRALEGNEGLNRSSVLGRALTTRAEVNLENGRYQECLKDVNRATELLLKGMPRSSSSHNHHRKAVAARAYRCAADAHEAMGNLPDAVKSLQLQASCNPSFRSKAAKAIQRLQAKAASP
jgi:tetratricopeptide (TPR) repeat protein